MLLDIAQYVLHIVVLLVVISVASITVASCREFHIHYWLVREVLILTVVLGGLMVSGAAVHQVSIGKTVVVQITLGKLLLIVIDFIQLRTHVILTAAHLATKDVAALSGSSWLSFLAASIVKLGDHVHLVWHHELLGIATISIDSCS